MSDPGPELFPCTRCAKRLPVEQLCEYGALCTTCCPQMLACGEHDHQGDDEVLDVES